MNQEQKERYARQIRLTQFGEGLVTSVLEQTDALHLATWLETFTPRNERFYQRLGYRVVGSFFEPTTESAYSLMIRPPGGT